MAVREMAVAQAELAQAQDRVDKELAPALDRVDREMGEARARLALAVGPVLSLGMLQWEAVAISQAAVRADGPMHLLEFAAAARRAAARARWRSRPA